MRMIARLLAAAWALVSAGVGVFAFSVVYNISDGHLPTAAREAFETIPEAIMNTMGFNGSPWFIDAAYWVVLAGAVFLAFRPRGARTSAD